MREQLAQLLLEELKVDRVEVASARVSKGESAAFRRICAWAADAGKPLATDVHTLADPRDEYNRDYLRAAQVLFLSDERLWASPEESARELLGLYSNLRVVVIGLGAEGALLAERRTGRVERYPAVYTRPVVNTIGAGDALFSAFIFGYARSGDAETALRRAMVFASYKTGVKGAAEGLLTEPEWEAWCRRCEVFQ